MTGTGVAAGGVTGDSEAGLKEATRSPVLSQLPRQLPSPSGAGATSACYETSPSPPPVRLHLHKPAFLCDNSPVFSLYLSTCLLTFQPLSGQARSRRQEQLLWHALNANELGRVCAEERSFCKHAR